MLFFVVLINHLSKTASKGLNDGKLTRRTTLTLLFIFSIAVTFGQTANFTAPITSGCSPLVVNFQDQSIGNITSWFWDFGNGATSTLKNPSTTYFTPGTYSVKLTVTSSQGSNTLTRNQYITVWGKPTVNLTVNDSVACFPHRAQFTDLSTASTGTSNSSWLWDFGDGTQATSQNPLHVYSNAGVYTVTLKVTNDKGCYAVFTKQSYITINGGVKADFSNTQPATCRPPFNISFTNNSTGTGALNWFWDFGDGNTSTIQNPAHTYTTPGNYTVSLAATSSDGCSDTLRKVSVLNIENISTTFSAPDSICINAPVNFQNTSTPAPASSSWNFGDATTSTIQNPVKTYSTVGNYTVTLLNTYGYCTDSVSKTIKVLPRPVANFTTNDTFRCKPNHTVNFQDLSANAIGWNWDFGDGGTSTQQHPTHTYTNYGNYNVRLIVTNASGCTDTLTKSSFIDVIRPVITIPVLPTQGCIPYTLSPVAVITTQDVVTSYQWNFGDGFTSTGPNPTHTYTIQGTYDVTLIITTGTGCTDTLTIPGAVRVGRRPVINFTAVPNPVCAFLPVQFTDLTNEADQWIWFFGDGGTANQQNPIHQYSDTGMLDVMLIAINNGCMDSLRKIDFIRIKPPIAKFGFQTNCYDRLQFNFIDSSVGALTWFWDFGDGTTSTQQNPVHFFPGLNTYNVSLTVTNDTCSHTLTKAVRVIDETPDFSATFRSACRKTTFFFSALVSNPANIAEYLWDFGDGSQWNSNVFNSGGSAYHYYPNSGFYTVTLITTDIYGCKDTVVKQNYIRVNGPVANFTATNTSGCKGLTTTFNDLSTTDGISNIVNWRWYFGDGTVQNYSAGPFQHTYSNPGTYSVTLVVTDAGGCKDSLILSDLVIATDPKANFSSADTLSCPGASVQFNNISTGINYSSFWDFGNGDTSILANPADTFTTNGSYTIRLKITDQYGCSDSITRSNYIKIDKPVANFTMSDSISSCTPFQVDFTNTSHYYSNYAWYFNGGFGTQPAPTFFYNTPGINYVQLVVTSPGGCIDSITKTVRIYDTVGSKVTYLPLNGCKPLSVNLDTYSPGPMTFTWDFGDGVLITNTDTTMNHIYNFFGNFVPKVIMTDPSGCIIPVSGLDTIRIKGATAKFGVDKKLFCDSGLVNFIDSTTYNDSLSSYHWDFGDGNTSSLHAPSHYYSSPGLYTVSLNVQTQNTCVDTFRLNNLIKVVQSPLVSIGGDSVVCIYDTIQHLGVFDRADTSVVRWAWRFPNGNLSDLQNPLPQRYNSTGNFIVNTIVTNSSGCADTASKNILVNPLPTVTLPSSITMQAGFPVTIPATYSPNVASYNWIPGATLSCTDCPQPTASPKFNTTYNVSFIDSNGCRNNGQVQIIVICKNANVFVPNTFSPNADGSNDVFYVRGKGLDRVKSLRIFNRWGEIVFEQSNVPVNDPGVGWNGRYKGNKPVADVYVYQVEVFCENSQIIRFEGNVALIQ